MLPYTIQTCFKKKVLNIILNIIVSLKMLDICIFSRMLYITASFYSFNLFNSIKHIVKEKKLNGKIKDYLIKWKY